MVGFTYDVRDLVWFGLVWFYGISTIVGYHIIFTNPSARAGYDTRSIFLSGV